MLVLVFFFIVVLLGVLPAQILPILCLDGVVLLPVTVLPVLPVSL